MPTQFNTGGFAGFSPGILRKRQVSGDNEWNPLPQNEGNNNYVFPTPIPSAGSSSTPRSTATPATTPRPTATPAGDNSNAGIVNPRLFRHDNTANQDFWEQGGQNPNRPHVAMDFETSPNASVAAGATVPQYPATASVFDEQPGYTYGGEPTVQTPRMAGSSLNLDTAPSLFESSPTNPFDEWWKTPFDTVTGNASVAAGANDGGSIWSGDTALNDFGSDLALGGDLSASLDSLQFGEDYPAAPESPFSPIAEGTGIPVEPDPLNQDTGDLVWTTSPDDRRFLPGSEESTAPPPVPTRSLAGGTNLRDFGNNLSLGAFLNTPLSSMRYGEGVESGSVSISGQGINWSSVRQQWERYNPTTQEFEAVGGRPPPEGSTANARNDGTGTTIIPIEQDAPRNDGTGTTIIPIGTNAEGAPPGMKVVGHDKDNGQPIYEDANGNKFVNPGTGRPLGPMSQQAYERATFGGVRSTGYRDPRGSAAHNWNAANRILMWSQGISGTPNDYSGQSDELTNKRGEIGRLDEFGNYEQTGNISGLVNHETYRGFRYGSQRSTVRGIPAWSGSGGRGG